MLRIDLGCGTNRQDGFTGVDRYPLPSVDVIADMNGSMPFPDDSVELLLASHSLEHVTELLATMQEIYRICKHGAQLCIVAPYSEQKLNVANPFHKWAFNEHTPRFWTAYPATPVDPEEFSHPHASNWGLSMSDYSNPGIDIRLVRLEYFYFPHYTGLLLSEQRQLRRERMDVCDQIMYHLIVWKESDKSQAKSFEDYVAELQPYEPEYIQLRRKREQEMLLQQNQNMVVLEEIRDNIARLEGELQTRIVGPVSATEQFRRVEDLTSDFERQKTLLRELHLEHHQERSSLTAALRESLEFGGKSWLAAAKAEILQITDERIKAALPDRDQVVPRETTLANELAALRQAFSSVREILECDLKSSLTAARAEIAQLSSDRVKAILDRDQAVARETNLSNELMALREVRITEKAKAEDEIRQLRSRQTELTTELARLQEHLGNQVELLSGMKGDLVAVAEENRRLRDDAASNGRELAFARDAVRREAATVTVWQAESSSLRQQFNAVQANVESCEVLKAKLGLTQAELETTMALLCLMREKEEAFAAEIAAARRDADSAMQEMERLRVLYSASPSVDTNNIGTLWLQVQDAYSKGGVWMVLSRTAQRLSFVRRLLVFGHPGAGATPHTAQVNRHKG